MELAVRFTSHGPPARLSEHLSFREQLGDYINVWEVSYLSLFPTGEPYDTEVLPSVCVLSMSLPALALSFLSCLNPTLTVLLFSEVLQNFLLPRVNKHFFIASLFTGGLAHILTSSQPGVSGGAISLWHTEGRLLCFLLVELLWVCFHLSVCIYWQSCLPSLD